MIAALKSAAIGVAFVLAGATVYEPADVRPLHDPTVTPGAVNPAVTQDNIYQTICVRGWTATIRPPVAYTSRLKRQQLASGPYAVAGADPRQFEEDHLIPLELAGHPTDPRNLWPEPWDGQWGAHAKDTVENFWRRRVCAGLTPLAEAQRIIATDWRVALPEARR